MKKVIKRQKGLDRLIHAQRAKVAQQFYRLILNKKSIEK